MTDDPRSAMINDDASNQEVLEKSLVVRWRYNNFPHI